MFHPKKRSVVSKKSSQSAEKRLTCNHQLHVCSGAVCGQMFGTMYQLQKHRKIAKYQANHKSISAAASLDPPPNYNNLSDSEKANPPPSDMSDSEGDDLLLATCLTLKVTIFPATCLIWKKL